MKLSEMYENPAVLGLPEKDFLSLELVVKVININEGRNREIAERCKKLSEYSAFVAKARIFEKELGSREKAVREVVKYCEKHDILKEFIRLHGTEVLGMLYAEWNMDDALAVRYEEGHADEKLEIARNAMLRGLPVEIIHEITGLDLETIEELRN
jgi:hypothetical protein